MEPDLQSLVDAHGCKYFAANDTQNGEILNLALRSPFIRLYAANRSLKLVQQQKQRFAGNERIQLFACTHDRCWVELVKLVPVEQPALFWIQASENVGRALVSAGRLRPVRRDVMIFEIGLQRGILGMAERHFSRTHFLSGWYRDGMSVKLVWGHDVSYVDKNLSDKPFDKYLLCPNSV